MPSPLDSEPCPSMEMVLAAIETVYHNPDKNKKDEATKWISQLQQSMHAWKVSDTLLHDKRSEESCYIAAQTMKKKIQNSFSELPPEGVTSLRDSLILHVKNINENTPRTITVQLCVALADLALQMTTWPNYIPEIMNHLAHSHPFALLEVLVVLPEEVNSRHLRLGANRRGQIMQDFRSAAPTVNEFLQMCLAQKGLENESYRANILRSMMSWISLGSFPLSTLSNNPILSFAFGCLGNRQEGHNVHEAATDAVCSLVERMDECQEESTDELDFSLYTAIRKLEEPYHLAVADEDIFKCVNFCRIFTEFAEALLTRMIGRSTPQSPHFALQIMDSILLCCGHPDYEVPDITFNLWYRLSEELYEKDNEQLTACFKPYVERLMAALCRHCQMETDRDGVLDEHDDFTEFRMRVTELIKDVVFVVGSANIFKHMFEYIKGVSATNWEALESALYIMSAVARTINPDDNDHVPQVVDSIFTLPDSTHIAVRHTSIRLIGELAEWIGNHPQYLERTLNWVLRGLQNKQLSGVSAMALQNICDNCRIHMTPHFDGLIEILQNLDSFDLKPDVANGLIKGVASILTSLPHASIARGMETLVALQTVPLSAILSDPGVQACASAGERYPIAKNTQKDPVLFLDRLASVFRFVKPDVPEGAEHPCQAVITKAWPVLYTTCETFKADVRVMERSCRTIRFAIRCVSTQSAPLLTPLVEQMVKLYSQFPHSCFLYLGSILVDEFSHIPECVPGLLSMLEAFLPKTFQLLQAQNGLRNHPDTVDDFFRLNARYLQRSPIPYLQTPSMKNILDCALLCATLDHRDGNASVMKFLFDLLHLGRSKEEKPDFDERQRMVTALKDEYGQKLISTLVISAVNTLPSYTLADVGDVMYELMLYDRVKVCHWLESTLTMIPGIGEKVTRKQMVAYHTAVTKATNPTECTEATRQFTRLWR